MPQGKASSGCQLFSGGQAQSSLENNQTPVTDVLPQEPRNQHLDLIAICLLHTEAFECLGESGKWEDCSCVLNHQPNRPAHVH